MTEIIGKELIAPTLRDLIDYLQQIAKEAGDESLWNGWDDGSVIISGKNGKSYAIDPASEDEICWLEGRHDS